MYLIIYWIVSGWFLCDGNGPISGVTSVGMAKKWDGEQPTSESVWVKWCVWGESNRGERMGYFTLRTLTVSATVSAIQQLFFGAWWVSVAATANEFRLQGEGGSVCVCVCKSVISAAHTPFVACKLVSACLCACVCVCVCVHVSVCLCACVWVHAEWASCLITAGTRGWGGGRGDGVSVSSWLRALGPVL